MSSPRYPEEFKIEAVKQVTERGLPVADVAGWAYRRTVCMRGFGATASPSRCVDRRMTSRPSYAVGVPNSSA